MSKEIWGWNESLEEYMKTYPAELEAGRVVKDTRHIYTLETGSSETQIMAEVSGGFQYRAVVASDFPVIGDWVLFRPGSEGKGSIEAVLPRKSKFSRKVAGTRTDEQILVSNIDVIFLVFGLNGGRNFTSSGLERYMTLAWDSGAKPVVILNKADLSSEEERESALLAAENSAPGVDIFLVSAVTQEGLKELYASVKAGMTIALTGPSGVGKSTIINALMGEELQKTTQQRAGDLRGRHTTTHKEMFQLPSGAILIDTPGLKEVQLWADEDALGEAFEDIRDLSGQCRFRDCSHTGEPGCAVQQALTDGSLEYRRYENYLELLKELQYLKTKQDKAAARLEREKWKNIAKFQKELKKGGK